jgi:hypothetical protein
MAKSTNALALTYSLLRGLVILNALYALGILTLFIASLVAGDALFQALGVKPGAGWPQMVLGGRLIMLAGLAGAYVVHRILRELQAIVETVRTGDPFVADNARRLQAIAWWVLVGEVLRLVIGALVLFAATPAQTLDVDVGFSLTPWLAVLLLIVLARVFNQGARMRADLEGTV